MASDVVLSAASRSNLLSLQNTQKNIDATQLRLATGKKVNSALDNPQSFFTSQSLSNRASDLTRLLDGIGQSISTIQEADKGVTALSDLIDQANSIVSSARDELAASDGVARITGSTDLRSITDLTAAGNIQNNDVLNITTVDDSGAKISQGITITTGDTAYTLAAKITDAFADNNKGEITAKVDATTGFLSIQSTSGRTFKIGDGTALTTGAGLGSNGYNQLGIGKYFELEQRGAATANYYNATVVAGNTAKSISLYEAPGNLVDAGDTIFGSTLTDANGNNVVANTLVGDNITFQVNNGTASTAISLTATTTWQDVVDSVNGDTNVNKLIKANFNGLTGQLEISSLSDSVENFSFNFNTPVAGATRVFNIGLGDPSGALDKFTNTAATTNAENVISFNSSTSALDGYAKDYNSIRTQINTLVKDAEYRGVNLLNGDNLTTFFNEDNSSKLVSNGSVFTAEGLGLTVASFSSSADIEATAARTKTAQDTVRTFGSSLSNNLAIIQARQTFTQETINTLKAGSDALTNADLNEEGANLLALQTAQQLGVTSLSLASQSQQSVLRLF